VFYDTGQLLHVIIGILNFKVDCAKANEFMLKELYRTEDKYGELVVTEQGEKRILSFASSLQQSAIYIEKPHRLVHEYTQIMLLGMMFNKAKNIVVLGLGGGGLVHCLNYYFPKVVLQAVDIRQSVIDIAYQWFNLPENSNINVHCNDAANYIQQIETGSVDIIFSDLYEAQGMSDIQLQAAFISNSYKSLGENGCMVINFHSLPDEESSVIKQVREQFSAVYMCDVFKGNWIVFCIKSELSLDNSDLKTHAVNLGKKMELPMKYFYKQLRIIPL